jgi:surfeit locus 1 family protein
MLSADGIPVGRPAKIELRNQHLIYAITWGSLGLLTAGLWLAVWKKGTKIKHVMGRMGR